MRKLLGVTVATAALSAFGMGGTASAACSTANGPDAYDNTGGLAVGSGANEVFVLGTNNDVGGTLSGVGHGQTDANAGAGGADYDGTLSNANPLVGYGDVDGSASTGGVSGSADGETANGAVSGSGSLSGTTLTVGATVAGVCLP